MYIIKISDLSYKIILSQSDFQKYGTDIFDGGEVSKTFFYDVIEKVNSEHTAVKKSSVIQADFFEDKFGGGELFLYFSDTSRHSSTYILQSRDFEDIITACKIINEKSPSTQSKLFYKDGLFYLALYCNEKEKEPFPALYEMGKLFKADNLFLWHLEEHASTLMEANAVSKAAYYFT